MANAPGEVFHGPAAVESVGRGVRNRPTGLELAAVVAQAGFASWCVSANVSLVCTATPSDGNAVPDIRRTP